MYKHIPASMIREAYVMMLGAKGWKVKEQRINKEFVWQLIRCKDDSARRLILGISR